MPETKTPEQSFYAALAKVQGELDPAVKDAQNPHLGNKYADLASCWGALKAVLPKYGFCVIQVGVTTPEDKTILRTTLAHEGGHAISGEIPLLTGEARGLNIMQAFGSAWTYARRYGLAAITGLTAEDSDGEPGRPEQPQGHKDAPPTSTTTPATKPTTVKPKDAPEPVDSPTVDLIESMVKLVKEHGIKTVGKKAFDGAMMDKWIAAMRRGKEYETWKIANLVRDLKEATKSFRTEADLQEMFGPPDGQPDPQEAWWADFQATDKEGRAAMLGALKKKLGITEAQSQTIQRKHMTDAGVTDEFLMKCAEDMWGFK